MVSVVICRCSPQWFTHVIEEDFLILPHVKFMSAIMLMNTLIILFKSENTAFLCLLIGNVWSCY